MLIKFAGNLLIFLFLFSLLFTTSSANKNIDEYSDIVLKWSSSGDKILFHRLYTGNVETLRKTVEGVYYLDLNTMSVKKISYLSPKTAAITWGNGDDEIIYFSGVVNEGNKIDSEPGIYSNNLTGTQKKLLISINDIIQKLGKEVFVNGFGCFHLSPDGKFLTFTAKEFILNHRTGEEVNDKKFFLSNNITNIFVFDLSSKKIWKISNWTSNIEDPFWSPESDKIVLIESTKQDDEIFKYRYILKIYDFDILQFYNLDISSKYPISSPTWSSKNEICYSRSFINTHGLANLYKLNSDLKECRITTGDFLDIYPDWSPDGKLIVFSSNRSTDEDRLRLFIINPQDNKYQQITW